MAIHDDLTENYNLPMQEALINAFEELLMADNIDYVVKLAEAIKSIRNEHNLFNLNEPTVIKFIWDDIRKNPHILAALMNTTLSWTLNLPDMDSCVNYFAKRIVPYTAQSNIVDEELKIKAQSYDQLRNILSANHWLFFMVFASTQLAIINTRLAKVVKVPQK